MHEDATNSATRPDDEPDDPVFVPTPPTPDQLAWLRERSGGDDAALASRLRRYREQEGWSHDQLAAHLGLNVASLDRLGLSGIPRSDRFAGDVRAIAAANGIVAEQLMHLLRAVESRNAFTGSAAARRIVAAARDHDDPTPAEDGPGAPSATSDDRPEDNYR